MLELLKPLFGSKTRVKVLETLFLSPEKSFFIRELTRLTNEPINAIRREAATLEKIGVLVTFGEKGKKYLAANKKYFFFDEIQSLFEKASSPALSIVGSFNKADFEFDLMIFTGRFIGRGDSIPIDLFLVGSMQKEKVGTFLKTEFGEEIDIRFSIISKKDFLFRLRQNDHALKTILAVKKNIIPVNHLQESIEEWTV